MRHILLTDLNYKKVKPVIPCSGFFYRRNLGVWMEQSGHELMINHKNFDGVCTKKKHIEAGEDQK